MLRLHAGRETDALAACAAHDHADVHADSRIHARGGTSSVAAMPTTPRRSIDDGRTDAMRFPAGTGASCIAAIAAHRRRCDSYRPFVRSAPSRPACAHRRPCPSNGRCDAAGHRTGYRGWMREPTHAACFRVVIGSASIEGNVAGSTQEPPAIAGLLSHLAVERGHRRSARRARNATSR